MARAVPGSLTEEYIRYSLPQERGWSYVHVMLVELGADTRWPRSEDNPEGRWWQKVLKAFGF